VNRYTLLCRLTWPAMLLLTGVLALMNEANILQWHKSWPLYLILWGVLKLAQRAALSSMDAGGGYPGYPGYYPPAPAAGPAAPSTSTSVVPASGSESDAENWRQ
jgi:hypothetical protein